MTAPREYLDYIQDIDDSISDIAEFVSGMPFEKFTEDKKTVNAVIRSLEVIGEAAKKVPNHIVEAHPEVPWRKMCGMRDKLIHEYFGVDKSILWQVAIKDLPPLRDIIKKILEEGK